MREILSQPLTKDKRESLLTRISSVNWFLILMITACVGVGYVMLCSVTQGNHKIYAMPQVIRFTVGLCVMLSIALIRLEWVIKASIPFYLGALALLLAVEFFGQVNMGAQRWIDLGIIRLQPSELMKIGLVLVLARYYHWLPVQKISHPFWLFIPLLLIVIPCFLVVRQPDLGTSLLMAAGAIAVLFLAGITLWLFILCGGIFISTALTIYLVKGTKCSF